MNTAPQEYIPSGRATQLPTAPELGQPNAEPTPARNIFLRPVGGNPQTPESVTVGGNWDILVDLLDLFVFANWD